MHDDPSGETIAERYQIIQEIGRGGMGAVYKALDTRLQRIVALKVLVSELDAESERHFAEARVQAKLLQFLHHPNILRTFDVGKVEGQAYLVVEYIEGRSLAQVMAEGKRLDLVYAIGIIQQVGRALEYAHQHGLVHRDVKPSNILVSNDDRVLLSDFGLAIGLGAPTRTEAGMIAGTPVYMSPEQAMGRRVDARSDIFSLGTVLYETLTGLRPFSGESTDEILRDVVEQSPVSPERLNPALPSPLAEVIMKALAKEPDRRFPSVAAFLTALEEAIQALDPSDTADRDDLIIDTDLTLEKRVTESVRTGEDEPTSLNLTPYEPVGVRMEKSKQYPSAIAWLLVLDPRGQSLDERPHQFRLADSVTIGRHTDNDLVLFDYEVWHHHARISLENGQFHISDLNSARGTFVNGVRVEKCALHDRDQIGIGERTLLFIQAVSPRDLNVEAERRLQEFDAVWDQLASSARHD